MTITTEIRQSKKAMEIEGMPNAKAYQKSKFKKILVWGPTGSGKTQLYTTLPGRKFVYMFDPSGLDTLAGEDIDYETFYHDSAIVIRRTPKGKKDLKGAKATEPQAYNNFEVHLEPQLDKGFPDHDVIIFDSITTLFPSLMDRICHINSRFGAAPELADYLIAGNTLNTIFAQVCSLGKTVVVVGHNNLIQDKVSRKIFNQLDITKGVRSMLPRNMTDVWVTYAEAVGSKVIHKIQTSPTKEYPDVKNSFGFDPFIDVEVDPKKPRVGQGIGRYF